MNALATITIFALGGLAVILLIHGGGGGRTPEPKP